MKFQNFAAILILLILAGCKKNDENILGNSTDGQIVVSTYTANYSSFSTLAVLDKYGNSIMEKATPQASVNFKEWQVDGKTRYSYMEFDTHATQLSPGILPTTAVILDENFKEMKRLRLQPYNGRTAADPTTVDAHDFIYLDDNHFITLSYFQKTVSNIPASLNPAANCKVITPIIQETVNGQVVWEWDGSNYPEFYNGSVEGNVFSNGNILHDYIHMNSLYIDPTDNNLICSMRNLNEIIKISRTDGHIIWRLGGKNSDFPVTASMKFLRQHHATLTDNYQTLIFLDNGEATERPYSRILEFQLDQQTKTISSYKAYTLPQNIFAQYMGSVQKRGDTYFISCGSTPKILEVNYVTNQVNFLLNLPATSYRALKY